MTTQRSIIIMGAHIHPGRRPIVSLVDLEKNAPAGSVPLEGHFVGGTTPRQLVVKVGSVDRDRREVSAMLESLLDPVWSTVMAGLEGRVIVAPRWNANRVHHLPGDKQSPIHLREFGASPCQVGSGALERDTFAISFDLHSARRYAHDLNGELAAVEGALNGPFDVAQYDYTRGLMHLLAGEPDVVTLVAPQSFHPSK